MCTCMCHPTYTSSRCAASAPSRARRGAGGGSASRGQGCRGSGSRGSARTSPAAPVRDGHLHRSTNKCLQYLFEHRCTVFERNMCVYIYIYIYIYIQILAVDSCQLLWFSIIQRWQTYIYNIYNIYTHAYIYIYIYICIDVHICIYIYIYREREIYMYVYMYAYITMYNYTHRPCRGARGSSRGCSTAGCAGAIGSSRRCPCRDGVWYHTTCYMSIY